MSQTMVEKVAEARAAEIQRQAADRLGAAYRHETWDGRVLYTEDPRHIDLEAVACAAIEAMREPNAGVVAFMTSLFDCRGGEAHAAWDGLITAALAQPLPPGSK